MTMTGKEFSDSIATYLANNFGSRGLVVYREVPAGVSIIGKRRRVDVFCVDPTKAKALAIECKFQSTSGTTDEKLFYALEDVKAIPMESFLVYGGGGYSAGIKHTLASSQDAVYAMPTIGETWELDCRLAMLFGWWDLITSGAEPQKFSLL